MYVRIVAAAGIFVAAALTCAAASAGDYGIGSTGSDGMLVADAAATPAPAAAAVAPSTAAPKTAAPKTVAPVLPAGVVFPTAIAAKYASQKASLARMHTCLDQYHIDKTNKALGGLVWIKKGGGYYSLCNAALKSATASAKP